MGPVGICGYVNLQKYFENSFLLLAIFKDKVIQQFPLSYLPVDAFIYAPQETHKNDTDICHIKKSRKCYNVSWQEYRLWNNQVMRFYV